MVVSEKLEGAWNRFFILRTSEKFRKVTREEKIAFYWIYGQFEGLWLDGLNYYMDGVRIAWGKRKINRSSQKLHW